MPTRNYTIQFDSDTAKLVAGLNQLIGLMGQFHHSTAAAKSMLGDLNLNTHAGAAGSLADNLGRIVGMVSGLGLVSRSLDELGEGIRKANKGAEEQGEKSLSRRDQFRELAGLYGESEVNDKVMGHAFSVAAAGRMRLDEARKFLQEFRGAIPAAETTGKIKPEYEDAVAAEAALFATRVGMEPGSAAVLAGMIPMFRNLTTGPDGKPLNQDQVVNQLAGELGGVHYGLNEGIGSISTLMRGEMRHAFPAILGGRVRSATEAATFVGIGSQFSGGAAKAGTRFAQLDRALNQVTGHWGDFLKEIGVSDAKTDAEKLAVLHNYIRSNGIDDINAFMQAKGLEESEERASTVGYLGNFELFQKRLVEGERRSRDGSATLAADREFAGSREAQNRLADLRNEFAEEKEGANMADLLIGRKNAMARLRNQGLLDNVEQSVADKFSRIPKVETWLGIPEEERKRIDDEYIRKLEIDAKNRGIDLEQQGLVMQDKTGLKRFNSETNAMILGRQISRLRKSGVDVYGDGGGMEAQARAMAAGRMHMDDEDALPAYVNQGMPRVQVDSSGLHGAAATMQHAGEMMLNSARYLARMAGMPDMTPSGDGPRRAP